MIKHLHTIILSITLFTIFIFTSCNNTPYERVNIIRFDQEVLKYKSLDEAKRESFFNEYQDIISILYPVDPYYALTNISDSPIYKAFESEVKAKYNNTDSLAKTLGGVMVQLNDIFPDVRGVKFVTVISPYNQSIFSIDSTLCIALNHYLGSDNKYYKSFQPYQRILKNPNQLSYNVAEVLIKENIDFKTHQNNLLENMIQEGLITFLVGKSVPYSDEIDVLGYTTNQLNWCQENESKIWDKIMEDKYLYSTSPIIINKFMKPGPFTAPISSDSPGRLGRWIGLQIVKAYVESKNLLDSKDLINAIINNKPQTILIDSHYDGK